VGKTEQREQLRRPRCRWY